MYVCMYVCIYVCMYVCMYIRMYVCIYVYTCYVLINPPMPLHYVLAAVFASCFYVLIYLLQEWGHIFDYVRLDVFASWFYVLIKIRFVSKDTQGGPLNTLYIRMYVCMNVCMYIHTYTYIRKYQCVCVRACVSIIYISHTYTYLCNMYPPPQSRDSLRGDAW